MNMLAQMSWGEWALAWLLILICCFLMLVILLQRGRGGGLSAAFGGGGGASAAFGAKTGDVFTWITVAGATLFVGFAVISNYVFDKSAEPDRPAVVSTTGTEDATEESVPGGITVTPVEMEGEQAPAPAGGAEPAADDQPTADTTTEGEGAGVEGGALEGEDTPGLVPEESPGESTDDEAPEAEGAGAEEEPGQ